MKPKLFKTDVFLLGGRRQTAREARPTDRPVAGFDQIGPPSWVFDAGWTLGLNQTGKELRWSVKIQAIKDKKKKEK